MIEISFLKLSSNRYLEVSATVMPTPNGVFRPDYIDPLHYNHPLFETRIELCVELGQLGLE
jgi:hypothetical protein